MPQREDDLESVLDRIEAAARGHERVSLDDVLESVGRRSFGPLLVVAGLIVVAPVIGDIPGVPTLVALLVLLIAAQIVVGRDRLWLPRWLLVRSVERRRLDKPLAWSRKPARWTDRVIRPRLDALVGGTASRWIAGICLLIAAAMPAMEVIPFSANLAGVVLLAFGLALIAHDGVVALIGITATLAALVLIVVHFI